MVVQVMQTILSMASIKMQITWFIASSLDAEDLFSSRFFPGGEVAGV